MHHQAQLESVLMHFAAVIIWTFCDYCFANAYHTSYLVYNAFLEA